MHGAFSVSRVFATSFDCRLVGALDSLAMALNHPLFIWQGPDNAKALVLPERSPIVLATQFLGWEPPRAGALPPVPPGLGARWVSIPHWKAMVSFGILFGPDPRTGLGLPVIDPFGLVLLLAPWERLLGELLRDGFVFAARAADSFALRSRIKEWGTRNPRPPSGPAPLEPCSFQRH